MRGPSTPDLLGQHPELPASPTSFVVTDALSRVVVYSLVGYALIRGGMEFMVQFGNPLQHTRDAAPEILVAISAGLLLLTIVQLVELMSSLPSEFVRKFGHVGTGVIALSAPLLFDTHQPALVVVIVFTGILLVCRRRGWLTSLHSPPQRGSGDILFLWAAYLIFLLTEGSPVLFLTPILVLTLADPAAALVGGRFGRTQWPGPCSGRTVEGSAAFLIVAFACMMLAITTLTETPLAQGIALSLLVGITTAAVEAVAMRGWDNIAVPFATLAALEFLIG